MKTELGLVYLKHYKLIKPEPGTLNKTIKHENRYLKTVLKA